MQRVVTSEVGGGSCSSIQGAGPGWRVDCRGYTRTREEEENRTRGEEDNGPEERTIGP